jgi:hypothetical protein
MPRSPVRVMLLVEDKALERFSREILIAAGVDRRAIRVEPYPIGRGDAKDWVDAALPAKVRELRSRRHQRDIALLAATDADNQTVAQRVRRLDESLADAGLEPRDATERIAFLVPKWSIDTWLLHYAGDTRHEDESLKDAIRYSGPDPVFMKSTGARIDWRTTAAAFVEDFRRHVRGESLVRPPDSLPALVAAFDEFARIA